MPKVRIALACLALLAAPVAAEEPAARVVDRGYRTACAEKDNVVAAISAPGASRFEVRARHPVYEPAIAEPASAPDFTDCIFAEAPLYEFDERTEILHDGPVWRLVGLRLPNYWRPEEVDVHVGGAVRSGLHLLQLFLKRPEGDVEFLVLYPTDGYWRPKPLPPAGREESPYGASFLIGPIENAQRPLVRLSRVEFVPEAPGLRVDFPAGGSAFVRVASLDAAELRLEVALDRPAGEAPVALVSSMYVAEDNADVGRMRLRPPGSPLWRSHPPQGFAPGRAAEIVFDKTMPSRHNTLAPDIAIGPFEAR